WAGDTLGRMMRRVSPASDSPTSGHHSVMNRRTFLGLSALAPLSSSLVGNATAAAGRELSADVVIVGGGVGGCAAALAAARAGARVILTEKTDWLGGQLTSQAVPPDEHPWIESFGCTRLYRRFRDGI